MMSNQDLDSLKKAAALKAVEFVRDGMVVGLGTGSTAKHMVIALGEKVRAGMRLRGVPTSNETAVLARQQGIAPHRYRPCLGDRCRDRRGRSGRSQASISSRVEVERS